MAPTRMKLRARHRDNAPAEGGAREEEEEAEPRRRSQSSRRKSKAPSGPAIPAAAAVAGGEEASPDSKCPICLDRFDNVAFLDRCLHRFCFPCIQEWSRSKAECPLCKQPFASILHSVRAHDDFKEYTLRPPPPGGEAAAATVAMVAAMATVARNSHQMRLTLRRHRAAEAAGAAARRRRRRHGARTTGGEGVWEWYLDPPALPRHADAVERQPAAERGIIFEGLEGAEAPVAPGDRASRRLMTRLAARRRLQHEGGMPRRLREREALALRRTLYRCGVRVRGVAGGDQGPQRDISAEGFRRSPALLDRLRPWLRRELTVLYGAHGSLVEIVHRIISVRLARHGLDDVAAVAEELRPFLLARTDHFLHELASFARSPLAMDSYDLQAVYEPPPAAATANPDWIGSSSDGSSVIAISEDDEQQEAATGGEEEAGPAEEGVANEDGCLSLSGWDDETPGPSYSSAAAADHSCSPASPALSPAPQQEEEECLIVGYKKPMAERTPELVQLSSDTEEEPQAPPLPPEAPPLSFPPPIPASTSSAFREEEGAGPRARSWSESSRNSACTLSPATPPPPPEKRRKRRHKKRRKRRRAAICNPNRSIFPAMMQQQRRRRRRSSGESGSPPSPAPSSSWESLSSSDSSSSSSPPPPRPPDPGGEKPGGKRKYKSRHLDGDAADPTWRPRRRRDRPDRRRTREERSPSVEIVYEGTVAPGDANPPGNKPRRRRRRHHRTQHGSSPVIITLDSDSSPPPSSPLPGSPLDFPLLPPLPLGGGAPEFPAHILDRGSVLSHVDDVPGHRDGPGTVRDLDGTLDPLTGATPPPPHFTGWDPESRTGTDRMACRVGPSPPPPQSPPDWIHRAALRPQTRLQLPGGGPDQLQPLDQIEDPLGVYRVGDVVPPPDLVPPPLTESGPAGLCSRTWEPPRPPQLPRPPVPVHTPRPGPPSPFSTENPKGFHGPSPTGPQSDLHPDPHPEGPGPLALLTGVAPPAQGNHTCSPHQSHPDSDPDLHPDSDPDLLDPDPDLHPDPGPAPCCSKLPPDYFLVGRSSDGLDSQSDAPMAT